MLVINVNEKFSGKDYICGLLQYGSDRDPKTRVNWDDTSDKIDIGTNEIVLRKYYFLIKLPKNQDKGCLIFQRKGSSGVQNIFMRYLRKYLLQYPDFMHIYPEICDKVPKEVEKYFENGIAIALEYVYAKFTDDPFKNTDLKTKKSMIRITLDNKNNESPKTIFGKITKKLGSIKDDPLEVKVKSVYEGSDKTFYLDDKGKARPVVELTENLNDEDYIGNIPEFKSIDREAKEIMKNNFDEIWKNNMV